MSQRFSDAEIAAELWHAMYLYRIAEDLSTAFGSIVSLVLREHEASTISRFATLPHAHPEQSDPNRTTQTIAKYGHVAHQDDMTG